MNKLIKRAISSCQKIIKKSLEKGYDPIRSESDFERMLANQLEKELEEYNKKNEQNYVVHTQISLYEGKKRKKVKYRTDILIMDFNKIQENLGIHKSFVYDADAWCIEVKYLHNNDSVSTALRDFRKTKTYIKANTTPFFVVLLENEDENKKNTIIKHHDMKKDNLKELLKEYNKETYCEVIQKI